MERRRIPNSLKKYRRMSGLSQRKVAASLGLQETSCISRWEKGEYMPGIEYLFRLSLLYKTSPTNLYYDLWHQLNQELTIKDQKLLAQHESNINNETYLVWPPDVLNVRYACPLEGLSYPQEEKFSLYISNEIERI